MVFPSLIRLAVSALWANKLRSGLTFLGVVVGFTSVMTIISALEGMMDAIESDLARLGPTTFIVQKWGMATTHQQVIEMQKRKPISMESVDLLEEGCELCETISRRTDSRDRVKRGERSLRDVRITGTTANYIDIVDLEVEHGRYHSYDDDAHRRKVAFIGEHIQEELFPGVDPLGKDLRIGGAKYTVVGIAKKRGSMFGGNEDKFIVIPFSSHVQQFGDPEDELALFVKARSLERMEDAQDEVRLILRSRRHVPYDKPDDFSMLTADNILSVLNQITRLFRMGLVGISSISVVVGGIVVMNIMMVAVTERTREIGIRKSVGARRRHILLQFLFEALFTTLAGGMVGVVSGFLIAESLVGLLGMDISPSALAITMGLTISVGIGVIFGIYPAMKASRLDPIKALSYE